mmetsp:Transcript_14285/g.40598  ORF Transcript_14285/g.40598 Transcript_14285/m.40598 type:complete len:222 (-) Transcript_14285:329-994(-)
MMGQWSSSRASPTHGVPPCFASEWFRTLAVIFSEPHGVSQVLHGDQSFHSQSMGQGPRSGQGSILTTFASHVSFPWPYETRSRSRDRFAMPHVGHSPIHSDHSVYAQGSGQAPMLHGPSSVRPWSHLAPVPSECINTMRERFCRPPPHDTVHSVHGVHAPYWQSWSSYLSMVDAAVVDEPDESDSLFGPDGSEGSKSESASSDESSCSRVEGSTFADLFSV